MGRFTVVTPNLNMGPLLGPTLESVRSNLRSGDEYFVIDGGSTDNSLEILRRFDGRLSGWISEPDHGYADAVAKGFARATGTFMCWINAGDILLKGALDRVREIFEHSGADFVFGDDLYIDESGKVISYSSGYVGSLHHAMLYGGWTPLQDACFWRRSAYERIGGINSRLRYAADYDLFLRFSIECKCQYVPIAFSAFRRHGGQKSIECAGAYLSEKATCRQQTLASFGGSALRHNLMSAYYWMLVRFRARILRWYWDRPTLRGRAVSTLSATG